MVSAASAAEILALASAYKTGQNQQAAKVAALVALYYQQKVQVEDAASIDRWLVLVIPKIIAASDWTANLAAAYYAQNRKIEVPGAPAFTPKAALGMIDAGVKDSLMAVGPGDYMNKAKIIQADPLLSPQAKQAALVEAKQVTTTKLAAATARHVQAGGRQTIFQNQQQDEVALGYVRVTKAKPCWFCAMLASRGLQYRPFKEGSFEASDARFTGDGTAKVHDGCGCSLKAVYTKDDPLLKQTDQFAEMWATWGAHGTGSNAALLFRQGYDHWASTGEMLDASDLPAYS